VDSHRVPDLKVPPQDSAASLVREHQVEVWRYLRYLGASPDLADDLAQETFVQLLRAPYEERGPAARSAWLRTVARNLFWKAHRRTPMAQVELEAIEAAFAGFTRDDGGEGALAELRLCLDELDGRARTAVRLHYEERRSRRDIGRQLQIGEDGVKSLLRRVRALLRACIERRRSA
jgi:RNA polymerase sigma-70 factor (ECF subfamily)